MRLDHIAYRVKDRHKTHDFFKQAFGYSLGTSFEIKFNDGSHADCLALVPPEIKHDDPNLWTQIVKLGTHLAGPADPLYEIGAEYHAPPEIFVSDGGVGSIVGDWVAERGGVGGIHHMAYQVEDVGATMKEWRDKGYVEFYTEEPIVCKNPNLVQVFSKPSELTGVVYELINREGAGFCEKSVKNLMESTK